MESHAWALCTETGVKLCKYRLVNTNSIKYNLIFDVQISYLIFTQHISSFLRYIQRFTLILLPETY